MCEQFADCRVRVQAECDFNDTYTLYILYIIWVYVANGDKIIPNAFYAGNPFIQNGYKTEIRGILVNINDPQVCTYLRIKHILYTPA